MPNKQSVMIRIIAHCPYFAIEEEVAESKAVKRLTEIRKNYERAVYRGYKFTPNAVPRPLGLKSFTQLKRELNFLPYAFAPEPKLLVKTEVINPKLPLR